MQGRQGGGCDDQLSRGDRLHAGNHGDRSHLEVSGVRVSVFQSPSTSPRLLSLVSCLVFFQPPPPPKVVHVLFAHHILSRNINNRALL